MFFKDSVRNEDVSQYKKKASSASFVIFKYNLKHHQNWNHLKLKSCQPFPLMPIICPPAMWHHFQKYWIWPPRRFTCIRLDSVLWCSYLGDDLICKLYSFQHCLNCNVPIMKSIWMCLVMKLVPKFYNPVNRYCLWTLARPKHFGRVHPPFSYVTASQSSYHCYTSYDRVTQIGSEFRIFFLKKIQFFPL